MTMEQSPKGTNDPRPVKADPSLGQRGTGFQGRRPDFTEKEGDRRR